MILDHFQIDDVEWFLGLAAAENWVAEAWEFEFLFSAFPEGCLTLRNEAGNPVGFVTSIRHDRSGWIGNLIVDRLHRGKGLGEALFVNALNALHAAGTETVWLTASKMGRPLYEKYGFTSIDTIIRWTGRGRCELKKYSESCEAVFDHNTDRIGWGDCRELLLKHIARRGSVLTSGSASAVIQPCKSFMQIGPIAAINPGDASDVMDMALAESPLNSKIYIDAPDSNQSAKRLLCEKDFVSNGENELMFSGVRPAYRPEYIYGLATLGSCG